jgi:hypothetical protein
MRLVRFFGILTALSTLGYMVARLFRRQRVTRIPVEEVS